MQGGTRNQLINRYFFPSTKMTFYFGLNLLTLCCYCCISICISISLFVPCYSFLNTAVKEGKRSKYHHVTQSQGNVVDRTFLIRGYEKGKIIRSRRQSSLSDLGTEYFQKKIVDINSDATEDVAANNFWSTCRTEEEIALYVQKSLSVCDSVESLIDLNDINVVSVEPPLVVIDNFISPDDCNVIVEQASAMKMVRSTLGTMRSECSTRTSQTVWLRESDNVKTSATRSMRYLTTRASRLTGLPPSHMENLQVVRYTAGQKFDVHTDHLDAFNELDCKGRLASCLIYLNSANQTQCENNIENNSNNVTKSDVGTFEGGSTYFPEYNISITPKMGRALFWWNTIQRPGMEGYHPLMYLDVDLRMRHAGNPVIRGEKWICNRWIHPVDVGAGVKGIQS